MIPHIPHEELLFLKDPQMDFISQYIHFLSAWSILFLQQTQKHAAVTHIFLKIKHSYT